jgi:transcriptional regulator of acetoin/glycerol metabolism
MGLTAAELQRHCPGEERRELRELANDPLEPNAGPFGGRPARSLPQQTSDPLVDRRRTRLAEQLPGLESELDLFFAEVDDGATAVACADSEGIVLFLRVGQDILGDVFGLGLWVGMDWHKPVAMPRETICLSAPVHLGDGQRAATIALLTRSSEQAARALVGCLARSVSYRAQAVKMSSPPQPELPDGPELAAHRERLAVADRVACGDSSVAGSLELAQRLAGRNIPMLLIGETGSGKEVFARAVHILSHRYVGPFVAVNCASLPEPLIESELFGYRPGAFSGASKTGYRGRIVQADGGVLFLDEIGDMPVALQARLLRVLETLEVTPLGSDDAVHVDIQIISATHRDLEQSVRDGLFRGDLYYRLCGMRINLPPLRERGGRRALMATVLDEESRGKAVFAADALDALEHYNWPGNLRELRNTLRVALALAEQGVVRLEHLPPQICGRLGAAPAEGDERSCLLREIERLRWNVSAVARTLGISRNTLYRRMRRLGIAVPGHETRIELKPTKLSDHGET